MMKLHIKFKSFSLIFQAIFIFLNYKNFTKCYCPKDNPIKKNGECSSEFCTEDDFKNSICLIDNEIVKTQWLNNIIIFDEYRYRFNSMAISKKGDFIFETSSEETPLNGVRLFFGLKKNGSYYFKNDNNEEIPTKKIIVLDDNYEGAMRYESNIFFIKINNEKFQENKEFLVSISLYYGFMELYDLDDQNILVSKIPAYDINNYIIFSKMCSLIELNNKEYLYFFHGRRYEISLDSYIIIKKYIFYDNILSTDNMKDIFTKEIGASFARNTNAFKTDSNQIVLFYVNLQNTYKIEVLNESLETQYDKDLEQIPSSYIVQDIFYFYKCIHLKENIGIFIYYLKYDFYFPLIRIEDINTKTGINTLFNFNLENITNIYQFNGYSYYNDLVKINNKRFSYISSSMNKTILYIILFDLYNNNKNINIRYYKINLYDFYYFKIYNDISSIMFNNFLVISLSVCNSLQCDQSADSFFTSLLFFSYFNSSDFRINITSYFSNNGNDDNDDITIPFPNNIKIDNNIFGYQIQEKIKITSIPNEINFYLINENKGKKEIKIGDEINPNNINITISPKKDVIKNNNTYFIEYQYQYTDPDFDTFNQYPDIICSYPDNSSIDDQKEVFNKDTKIHFNKSLKIEFKLCNENCKTCKIIGKSNSLTRCEECFENIKFIFDEKTKSKTCFPECSMESSFLIFEENIKCANICDYEVIKSGKCWLDNTKVDSLKLVYSLFSNIILNDYNNEEAVLKGDEYISFHLTNTFNEKEKLQNEKNDYYNLSIIDLGDCENKLKAINGIPNNIFLILLKFESYYENSEIRNVQYEIYNPITKLKITNLSICQNDIIDIYVPTNLDNDTLIYYKDIKNQGYDIYNPNDAFFHDVCTKYTSVNYTDLTLNDRRDIFYQNQTFCQENCHYNGINLDIMHAKCECSFSNSGIEYEIKKFSVIAIFKSFYEVIKYSNFLILRCYKEFFSSNGIKNNYGFIIMTIFISLLIIFTIIFLFTGMKIIKKQITNMICYNIRKVNSTSSDHKNKKLSIFRFSKVPSSPNKKKVSKNIIKIDKRLKMGDLQNYDNLYQTKFSKSTLMQNESNRSKVNNNNNSKKKMIRLNSILVLNQKNFENDTILKKNTKSKKEKKIKGSVRFITKQKSQDFNKKTNLHKYNEFELDDLEYSDARKYDKRTFFDIYCCFVKREHLYVFTLIYWKDLNLISAKLSLLVFSISLDMTTNLFFFNDDSMHKIYLDYGKYNFISQIPQIIYSTIISETMDIFLKYLSLSEKEVYEVKKYHNAKKSSNEVIKLIKCLKIKFFFFFLICFIFMIFFWYFISVFCAIYENTQFTFFKDCVISLLISIIYPFLLYFIPSTLRIISLRSKKKDKKFMYNISNIFHIL